jgi:hypothetical protein
MTTKHQNTDFFIHILKTAGSTMMSIIWRQYRHKDIFHVRERDFSDFRALPVSQRNGFVLVGGHMCYGVHEFVTHPGRYFTILRDPYKRIHSYYYYMRSRPESEWYQMTNSMDLAQFIKKSGNPELNNGQLRRLYGVEGFEIGFGECPRDMLDEVKTRIADRFSVIGLTERFYETSVLMSETNSWKLLPFFYKNVTRGKPNYQALNTSTREVILKYNQLDMQLYKFAEERLAEMIQSSGKKFLTKVRLYRFVNQLLNELFAPFQPSNQVK